MTRGTTTDTIGQPYFFPSTNEHVPLLGAIYLLPLDAWARNNKIDYVRYMVDVVIFTKKRQQLKRVLKIFIE